MGTNKALSDRKRIPPLSKERERGGQGGKKKQRRLPRDSQ